MPKINVSNSELYFSLGEQGRPALLFIHGSGCDHTLWGQQVRQFKQDFTIAALDLNGHGRSPAREGDGLQTYIEDVVAVIDTLAMPTVLVGHSLGGAIALSAALEHPKNLLGLGLIGTGARLKVHPRIMELCQSNFESAIDLVLGWAFTDDPSRIMVEHAREQMRRNGMTTFYRDFVSCAAFDVMTRLSEIHVPTLVLCGQEDKLTPVKYSEYLKTNIPNAQLKIIQQAGHMVMLEKPETVNQILGEFCLRFG